MLYILTSIMVLRTPNTGQNMVFLVFHMKNVKKEEKEGKWSFCSNIDSKSLN